MSGMAAKHSSMLSSHQASFLPLSAPEPQWHIRLAESPAYGSVHGS